MKKYVTSIIPRLKEFSANLDKKELFIDVPWVIINENLNQEKYIFKRNGELIMSLNGQVTIGKWEYLLSARSLLIDRIHDKILLNQNFIDSGVMILNKDGAKNDYFFFANELIITDLDIFSYIKKIFHNKKNIIEVKLKNGKILEINDFSIQIDNNIVTIEGDPVADGILELHNSRRKYLIKNGRIDKIYILETFKTDLGIIEIERQHDYTYIKGNLVFKNGSIAPDGKYRVPFLRSITVENGIIIKC